MNGGNSVCITTNDMWLASGAGHAIILTYENIKRKIPLSCYNHLWCLVRARPTFSGILFLFCLRCGMLSTVYWGVFACAETRDGTQVLFLLHFYCSRIFIKVIMCADLVRGCMCANRNGMAGGCSWESTEYECVNNEWTVQKKKNWRRFPAHYSLNYSFYFIEHRNIRTNAYWCSSFRVCTTMFRVAHSAPAHGNCKIVDETNEKKRRNDDGKAIVKLKRPPSQSIERRHEISLRAFTTRSSVEHRHTSIHITHWRKGKFCGFTICSGDGTVCASATML